MRHVLAILAVIAMATGAGLAADASSQKKSVPYRLVPLHDYSVTVRNWGNENDPHYSIITNAAEWKLAFPPAATMKSGKPFQPDASLFKREHLLAVSRISDAPASGERVLVVKSLVLEAGEVVLTYDYIPPANKAGYKVINTLLLAIPNEYPVDGIRIVEQIETPTSLATQAGVEAARAAGRIKPPEKKR